MELSETCVLCLSRLLSLIHMPRDNGRQPSDVDETIHLVSTSQQQLLFKLDCRLDDVNVFTLSNVAGKKMYRCIFCLIAEYDI